MNNSDFVHLHVHSEYSLLDGLGKPEHYVKRAKELGFLALAVTDHANIDAHLKWQKACEKEGVAPILGCELYVVEDMLKKERGEVRGHITVLVKNLEGWQALARILTVANLEGFYGKPRIDGETLLKNINDGLIVLTGCSGSFLTLSKGVELLVRLKERGIDCYLEVMPHLIERQVNVNKLCVEIDQKYSLPFVATNDCHYVMAEHAKAQEVLLAIQRQAKWKDPDRWRFEFEGLYLREADEMIQMFKEQAVLSRGQYTRAMINSRRVAEQCWNFRLPKQEVILPLTPYELKSSEITADQILDQFCQDKKKRMEQLGRWGIEYQERYNHEVDIIRKKGFARYFLIVYEVVQWCEKNSIMVGPGRGSVGGSLVSYLLGITRVDPLYYDLLFERFISEDRIDYPDIDLDFEDVKCDFVRQHLEDLYGRYNVVGISTFLTMKGRAVVRDVGRVFDLPVEDVDSFAKSIHADPHDENIVFNSSKETREGQRFAQRYPEEFRLACILEGQIRGAGQHPAGLILSGKDLREGKNCALYRRSDSLVCNWDMEDCESNGLIKIDVLKLGTLSVLNEAKRLIFRNTGNILYFHPESDCYLIDKEGEVGDGLLHPIGEFDYSLLPLNDKKIFNLLSQGDTSGVFQFSGYACTELGKKVGIDSFDDMTAVTALARPGPTASGMTELYIRRKKGEKWEPLHPVYEVITRDTYGVMVYQEQMMRAMTDLAGFSNSDADRIRKIIAKKSKAKEFEPYREAFLKGCQEKKTLVEGQAEKFWEGLLEWAHYAFNKCLTGDTELTRSSWNQYTGKNIKLKDLYLDWHSNKSVGSQYRWRGLDVIQMSNDNRCRPARVIGIFYQGKKEVFEITTQMGKKIKGTLNHRLYSYEGYKTIGRLKVGDRLAIIGKYQQSITERKGQKWKKINTKGKCGFQKGKNNPSYVDGRKKYLEEARKKVLRRSKGKCEKCFVKHSSTGYQFAHIISPVEEFNGDYFQYHSEENILYLCQSCHHLLDYEKGERKKRYSKGYPIYYDPIISIKKCGEEEVFDVEMEGPNHNFIANGIVSHNSHAVEYSMIGYWTAWLKVYHPTEFLCAQLTYGTDKEGVVKEAENMGMKIITPKIGTSDARRWIARDKFLYMPFIEIKGIGETQADKCISVKQTVMDSRRGFFGLKERTQKRKESMGKLEGLLTEIKAFDPDPSVLPENMLNYFQYSVSGAGNEKEEIEIKKKRMHISPDTESCVACGLRSQAGRVVLSSLGLTNVLALGEASGREEDNQGMGFVGDAGKLLWRELADYGITRRMIHVANCCKCFVDPNVEIFTSKGVKKISEIGVGDLVLTHKGRFKEVKWIRPREVIKRRQKLISIKYRILNINNRFRSISVTFDHPFLIGSSWKEAKEIQIGDRIKVLAKRCFTCGALISYYQKSDFCSGRCATVYSNKNREWSDISRDKVSKNMKRLFSDGILDGKVLTKNANEVTRQKIKDGSFHLLSGPNRPPCSWKGQTRYENESLNRAVVKAHETMKKKGHYKRLAKIGAEALRKYYETHEYKQPSGNVKLTKIECIMAWALKKKGITFSQNPYLNRCYPDILIEDCKIVIECDGDHWHSSDKAKRRDRKRGLKLKRAGYTVLRFSEDEIKRNVFKCVDEVERVMANHDGKYEFTEVEVVGKRVFQVYVPKTLYNFGVEEDESYIANGLVSHNCWPSRTRTPSKEQIDECFKRWMIKEILSMNCRLILATGNIPLYALTGRDSGITTLSGQMEWVEKVKAWVVWCVHPSAILRNRRSNIEPFQRGIEAFADAFNKRIKT